MPSPPPPSATDLAVVTSAAPTTYDVPAHRARDGNFCCHYMPCTDHKKRVGAK